ncbi:MAG: hypothetical protein ACON49_07510 [Candidatus Puniceispirillaceae bacterium]
MSVFFATIGKILLDLGTDYARDKIAARQSFRQAQDIRLQQAAQSQADWQAFMAEASRHSWKDEAWTLCFILIFLMCFIPALQDYVATGFALLGQTPQWFQWACLASIGASFGLRGFDKFQKSGRLS